MIKRFEDEYPETRLQSPDSPDESNASLSEASIHSGDLQNSIEIDAALAETPLSEDENEVMRPTLSRHNSDVSLASKALNQEEGRMHRMGQQVRRDILKSDTEDHMLKPHLLLLRGLVDDLGGDEIKRKVEDVGPEGLLNEINNEASVLRQHLMRSDPDGWERFRQSHEAARRNQEVAGTDPDMSAIE